MCFISALFTKMKPRPEKWQLGDFSRVISCKKRKHSFLAIKLEDVFKNKQTADGDGKSTGIWTVDAHGL